MIVYCCGNGCGEDPDLIRMVEGIRGEVAMQMELIIRFDYGRTIPWVRTAHGGLEAIAGPNGLILRTPVKTQGKDLTTVAEFTVEKGERVPFVLTWFASHSKPPRAIHPDHALRDTERYWKKWATRWQRCLQSVSARRLWRGLGHDVSGARGRNRKP